MFRYVLSFFCSAMNRKMNGASQQKFNSSILGGDNIKPFRI